MTLCLLPLFLFPGSNFVLAQENPYIAGTVTDSKGVPIPGANVSISAGANKLAEQLTDLDGSFRFDNVQPGTYQLTTEIGGFVKFSKEAVDVLADSSPKLAIHLEPLPRPASPKVSASSHQAGAGADTEMTPSFQSAAVTDLPGLNQFQQDLSQEQGTASAGVPTRRKFFVHQRQFGEPGCGQLSDPEFRGHMMDAARQMGFQIQEFSPGGGGPGGGSGEMGGGGARGGPGGGAGGGPGGGGPGGAAWDLPAQWVEADVAPVLNSR